MNFSFGFYTFSLGISLLYPTGTRHPAHALSVKHKIYSFGKIRRSGKFSLGKKCRALQKLEML
jgi:hypothetical protein